MVRVQGILSLIVVFNLKYQNDDTKFKLDRKVVDISGRSLTLIQISLHKKFIKINNIPNTSVMNLNSTNLNGAMYFLLILPHRSDSIKDNIFLRPKQTDEINNE